MSFVSRALRVPTLLLLLTAVLASLLVSIATASTTAPAAAAVRPTLGQLAVAEAARHRGAPYQWGAAGRYRFDCSGLTMYVYRRLGRSLPHNSAMQYTRTLHISKAYRRPGDLIFMRSSSGRISHVGIYAGRNTWWVAPHAGARVKLQTIYSPRYLVGRVR